MVLDKGIQLVIDMPQDDDVDTGMGKRSLITSKQAAEAKKKNIHGQLSRRFVESDQTLM